MFDKLRQMTNGDETRMAVYISMYKEATTHNISALANALREENFAEIRIIVHSAKPLFTVMGFEDLWTLANEIETCSDSRSAMESCKSKVEQLMDQLSDSLQAIDTSA